MIFSRLVVCLSVGVLSACVEQTYEMPILEDLTSDSIYWLKLEESEKSGDYFILDEEVYCGEVAHNSYPLKKIDFESFEVLSGTDYAKDKNHVLYPLQTICVDGRNWGNCHCTEYIIEGADPLTFEYIGDGFAKDKKNVYSGGVKIKNAISNEFENLGEGYARDLSHVYFRSKILNEVDPNSFEVLENGMGQDSSKTFCYGTLQTEE